MVTEEALLSKTKKLIETKLGWGDSRDWTNQDFLALSKKIQEEIEVPVSHVTLKRIWGKVRYDSLPNTFTLSTLVQFIGYENWRDFKVKNGAETSNVSTGPAKQIEAATTSSTGPKSFKPKLILAGSIVLLGCFIWFISGKEKQINIDDYSFAARKTLTKGVPNSVIFDYDASRSPTDSVIIQQSWDINRRTKVSRDQRQRTLIYYLPGYFEAKLVVADKIVKEQGILIESDGWLAAIDASPMPVYFKKEDLIANGRMALSIDKIKSQNIRLAPQAPVVSYLNVKDFGEIYSDNFIFETFLRNDYKDGSSVCQKTNIYLLCEGAAIGIPLCNIGCVSDMMFFFTGFSAPGKEFDLSAFGVDFDNFIIVRIESSNGKAKVFLNGKLSYEVDHGILRSKIIGIDFTFQGSGSVDYVKLSNQKVTFEEEF